MLEAAATPTGARPSDRQLVARIRRGDDRAFETLYQRYQRRIAAYVLGMVKDHGRAEDVTQEVFVSAMRRMRQTERPIAFKPWIYEIAKNACIDAFRRSRRTEEVSYDAEERLAPNDYRRLLGLRRVAGRGRHRQGGHRAPAGRVRRAVGHASRDPGHARARGSLLPRDR